MKIKKEGISLIVLIITIVVIIILAAAIILTIANNNPVNDAKKATLLNDVSEFKNQLSLYVGKQYIATQGKFKVNNLDNHKLEEIVPEVLSKYEDKFLIQNGEIVYTDQFTAEEQEWLNTIITKAGFMPTIPNGFSYIEGTVATGYVIQDDKGNEFVWVPVNSIDEFVRENGYENGELDIGSNFEGNTEPYFEAPQSEIDEYNAMMQSVTKYHGFYIARYQPSQGEDGKPESKKNTKIWSHVKWGTTIIDPTGGAPEIARTMYPAESATDKDAVSTLIYGVQWDAAVRWIKINYPGIEKDSSEYGNYNTSMVLNTGSNEKFKTNNIYDMAGNAFELTMEAGAKENRRIGRGGAANVSGLYRPISNRATADPNSSAINMTFRVALYVK